MASTVNVPDRLAQVQDRIAAACHRAGRSVHDVKLVAVSKRVDLDLVIQACESGQWILGENRVDDALERQEELATMLKARGLPADQIRWHFIGHLQSRKASSAGGRFSLIHGVESLKLAKKLDVLAVDENRREPILLEVNAGKELQKHGLDPEQAVDILTQLATFKGLEIQGMMTMAPYGADESSLRKTFALLRTLNEDARRQSGLLLPELSMGMSGDFEQAILEGATLVRVGSAIFGPRA